MNSIQEVWIDSLKNNLSIYSSYELFVFNGAPIKTLLFYATASKIFSEVDETGTPFERMKSAFRAGEQVHAMRRKMAEEHYGR